MSTQAMAADCVSLSFKYASLIDCVKGQRPALIAQDPVLTTLAVQIEALTSAFEDRVRTLASEGDLV